MKIIHTSDWHLGHLLYGYDRTAEHRDMLRQIIDITAAYRPDVMLVCGDIFHTSQPSASVQTMLTNALTALLKASPGMTIVTIAGNHDSASRHDIFREPWQELGVHTFGSLDRTDPASHIVGIKDKGFVIAVPYTYERNLPDDLFRTLTDEVARRNTGNLPVVMMAHTTVAGSDFSGHDDASGFSAGGIDAIGPERFGDGFDYLALGHIHSPQTLRGTSGRIRYSGSPLAVSFSECYPHSVSLVEIRSRGDIPVIATETIGALCPAVSLPASGHAGWDKALELLRDFPSDIEAYIRLNIKSGDALPSDIHNRARMICEGKAARFCCLNICHGDNEALTGERTMTVEQLRESDPVAIARRYAADTGTEFPDEWSDMLGEVIREIDEEKRND